MNRERWIFFRTLSTMLSAGIPVFEGLLHASKQFDDSRFGPMADVIASEIASGRKLSAALSLYPSEFSSLQCHMIRVGEETGGLDLVLRRIADLDERRVTLQQLLVSRLGYPAFLFAFAIFGIIFLPAFCTEGLFKIIESTGTELPLLTKLFMGLSRALRNPIVLSLLGLGTAGILFQFSSKLKEPKFKDRVVRFLLRLPYLGRVIQLSSNALLAESLALQLEAGVSVLQSLSLAAEANPNPLIREELQIAIVEIKNGLSFGESLATSEHLDKIFLSMLRVGDETGRLSTLLAYSARYCAAEVEHSLDILASALEPLILCVMGILFGLMLVATMTPLVRLVQTL